LPRAGRSFSSPLLSGLRLALAVRPPATSLGRSVDAYLFVLARPASPAHGPGMPGPLLRRAPLIHVEMLCVKVPAGFLERAGLSA
jgi:hypothetical protein